MLIDRFGEVRNLDDEPIPATGRAPAALRQSAEPTGRATKSMRSFLCSFVYTREKIESRSTPVLSANALASMPIECRMLR
jgi:hypothetical protein